jgi:two-component system, sensor histidine kinase and response regulator
MLRGILVVDDSGLLRQLYKVFLSRYRGARVVTAENGAEALQRLAGDPEIDLVLLDIQMPVMGGVEVLERLQASTQSDVPVIVISTKDKQPLADQCLKLGARAFLQKPFTTVALFEVIQSVTGARPS